MFCLKNIFRKSNFKFQRELNNSSKKGFTLIELMVVISVIGLLSSIVLVSMQGARKKARDSVRKQDIDQIEKALLLYWNKHEQFPSEACFDGSIGSDNCGCGSCGTAPGSCTGNDWCHTSAIWRGLVDEGFIGALPKDPINNTIYYYWYEPCCNQNCGGGRSCVGKGCCEYHIGAKKLETTESGYTKWGRWQEKYKHKFL